MDLKVPYNNLTNAEEAYKKACSIITPEYIEKWKVKANISYDEASKTITATGKGFDLELIFSQECAEVKCNLSFLLKPFKKNVLSTIEDKLKRHI